MKRLKFVRYDNRKHFDSMFLYMSDVEEQRMFLTYTSANSVREFENWLENQLRSYYKEFFRFLYKGIIIKHNKTEPTYTKTSLFLCEKRRFFMARTEKGVVATI